MFDNFVGLVLKGLTMAFDRAVLCGSNYFIVIVVLPTKSGTRVIQKRLSFFRKHVSKLKPSHMKMCRSLKRGVILKIPSTLF